MSNAREALRRVQRERAQVLVAPEPGLSRADRRTQPHRRARLAESYSRTLPGRLAARKAIKARKV